MSGLCPRKHGQTIMTGPKQAQDQRARTKGQEKRPQRLPWGLGNVDCLQPASIHHRSSVVGLDARREARSTQQQRQHYPHTKSRAGKNVPEFPYRTQTGYVGLDHSSPHPPRQTCRHPCLGGRRRQQTADREDASQDLRNSKSRDSHVFPPRQSIHPQPLQKKKKTSAHTSVVR